MNRLEKPDTFRLEKKLRVTIRFFVLGTQRREWINVDAEDFHNRYVEFLETHEAQLLRWPHMFEIEFLDEPEALQRFFRFGTDKESMTQPIRLPGGTYADQN
jgi:hypothetical protein